MQVAKLLGRSLATVRRLEGQLLFPRRNARGVWIFNERKVRELAGQVKRGKALAPSFKQFRSGVSALPPTRLPNEERRRIALAIDSALRALRNAKRSLQKA